MLCRLHLLVAGLMLAFPLFSQIREQGIPPSWSPVDGRALSVGDVPVLQYAKPDPAKLVPDLFTVPQDVDIDPARDGRWTDLAGGRRVWQCVVSVPGGSGMVLFFDRFHLPEGGQFYTYNADKSQMHGAFTARSTTPSGKFLIGPLAGDRVILEYLEPVRALTPTRIHLNRLDVVVDPSAIQRYAPAAALDFGNSQPCNINVNCTQGNGFQNQKRGVARMLVTFDNGVGWCTGSLIANTAGTRDPLFLSAHHCQILGLFPDFDLWRFDFHYESPNCSNPAQEPVPKSVLGASRLAWRPQTDFLLFRLNPIPGDFNVYYNGWSRVTNPASFGTTFIHHPKGDIKKITTSNDSAKVHMLFIFWTPFPTSPPYSHWRVVPNQGIFEPGSSGCALFDNQKRIIGQLHGGLIDTLNACHIINAFFGRFDLSWNEATDSLNQLKYWLDKAKTNPMTLNGYDPPQPPNYTISGAVRTPAGTPMPNVRVRLTGSLTATAYTGADGKYSFPTVPAGQNYTLTPERDTNDINGITTYDLVVLNKHLLGIDEFSDPWRIIGGDINNNGSVTTFDLVETRKLLLDLYQVFPAVPSWRFFPSNLTFSNPTNPFADNPLPEAISLPTLQSNITDADFIGVKMGDFNNSANPGQ